MAYEIFTQTGTRNKEFISITETNSFGLSRAFLDKYKITSEHKAVILYDAELNSVALHFSENNPKFGFAVRIPNEKHGATIIAKSFFELKKIDSKIYAGRYSDFKISSLRDLGLEKDGPVYIINLKTNANSVEQSQDANLSVLDQNIGDLDVEKKDIDDIPF